MKKIIIFGLTIVSMFALAGYLYSMYFDKDTYTSYSQLIVINPKSSNQASDYASIARSRTVLEEARLNPEVRQSLESLQSNVKSTNAPGTNIVSIEATGATPQESRRIAQVVTREIGNQAKKLYNENNTRVVDEAAMGTLSHKNDPTKSTLVGAAAGIALTIAFIFLFYEPKRALGIVHDNAGKTAQDEDFEDFIDDIDLKKSRNIEIKPVGHRYMQSHDKNSKMTKLNDSKY